MSSIYFTIAIVRRKYVTRHFTNKIYLSEEIENIVRTSEFLGKGNNGVVYRIDPKTIIKIFNEKKVCLKEHNILAASSSCSSFPAVYDFGDYYIVREFVDGVRLDKYLDEHPLNKTMVKSIVNLIADFKKLEYKKLDIRCKDLYVQDDYSLKVIDPKNNYNKEMDFPRHLMKGIYKRDRIGEFFYYLYGIDIALYDEWRKKFKKYLETIDLNEI